MLLYKYRAMNSFDHLLDILLNERLFCPKYENLNDPFEGQYLSDQVTRKVTITNKDKGEDKVFAIHLSNVDPNGNIAPDDAHFITSIADLLIETDNTRVCSLTDDPSEVRMWSLYADSHRGVVIEIDFEGLDSKLTKVNYLNSQLALKSANPTVTDILSNKTNHWKYESEYRIIGETPFFDIKGRIKRVIVGVRADENKIALIEKICAGKFPITKSKLDYSGIKIII